MSDNPNDARSSALAVRLGFKPYGHEAQAIFAALDEARQEGKSASLRSDETDALYAHASLLISEGGQNREIGRMLRALLEKRQEDRAEIERLTKDRDRFQAYVHAVSPVLDPGALGRSAEDFGKAAQWMADEIERLRGERDALYMQLTGVGIVPYLDRMDELAKRAEAAEAKLAEAQTFLSAEMRARNADLAALAAERAKTESYASDWRQSVENLKLLGEEYRSAERAKTAKLVEALERGRKFCCYTVLEQGYHALDCPAAAKASEPEQYEVRDPYGRRMDAETKAYNKAKASE